MTAANKATIVNDMAEELGRTKTDIKLVLETLLETVSVEIQEGKSISISGFGDFSMRRQGERVGRNPKTGEEHTIKARSKPHFQPDKSFKRTVRQRINNNYQENDKVVFHNVTDKVHRVLINTLPEKKSSRYSLEFINEFVKVMIDRVSLYLAVHKAFILRGFGTFEVRRYDNAVVNNPKNGETFIKDFTLHFIFHPSRSKVVINE